MVFPAPESFDQFAKTRQPQQKKLGSLGNPVRDARQAGEKRKYSVGCPVQNFVAVEVGNVFLQLLLVLDEKPGDFIRAVFFLGISQPFFQRMFVRQFQDSPFSGWFPEFFFKMIYVAMAFAMRFP